MNVSPLKQQQYNNSSMFRLCHPSPFSYSQALKSAIYLSCPTSTPQSKQSDLCPNSSIKTAVTANLQPPIVAETNRNFLVCLTWLLSDTRLPELSFVGFLPPDHPSNICVSRFSNLCPFLCLLSHWQYKLSMSKESGWRHQKLVIHFSIATSRWADIMCPNVLQCDIHNTINDVFLIIVFRAYFQLQEI